MNFLKLLVVLFASMYCVWIVVYVCMECAGCYVSVRVFAKISKICIQVLFRDYCA